MTSEATGDLPYMAKVMSSELLTKLELEDLDLILRERRLCWFGHVEHSSCAVRLKASGGQGGSS